MRDEVQAEGCGEGDERGRDVMEGGECGFKQGQE